MHKTYVHWRSRERSSHPTHVEIYVYVQWRSGESSHCTCFDLPTDHITCLLVEWCALAGTIVWVADRWLLFTDYAVLLCEAICGDGHHNSQEVLTCSCSDFLTCLLHGLLKCCLLMGIMVIHFPVPGGEKKTKLLKEIQEWRVGWEEHH